MQLEVKEYTKPQAILFNYAELKQEIQQVADQYAEIAYTENQLKEAKADKARLTKFKKALNDERIRLERE
jgi:hypothetical protein